jgi:hypothetical protein
MKKAQVEACGAEGACNSVSTALLQSISEIGTQCATKNHRNALHELFPTDTPNKPPERNTQADELADSFMRLEKESPARWARYFDSRQAECPGLGA